MTKGRRVAGITSTVLLAGGLTVVLVASLFFDSYRIASEASAPTLNPGDRILVGATEGEDVARGDLVMYVAPGESVDDSIERVSRVIAVSGDSIEQSGDSLVVNGEVIEESYLPAGTTTADVDALTVPTGHVFVLGDNRLNSQDSRAFGPLPADNVRGVVRLRWWPLGSAGAL